MNRDEKPSPLETVDTEIGRVRVDENREIVVNLRQHGGKAFVRWRYWHRHLVTGKWYPDSHLNGPRAFILPIGRAADLGRLLVEAAEGEESRIGETGRQGP